MNQFIGIKFIEARPMNRADYVAYRGWTLPINENGADEGFLVEYLDGGVGNDDRHKGYITWTPSEPFNKAYRPVKGMTFGMAIEALKIGQKVARSGWNGKGMFVYYVPPASYPVQTEAARKRFGYNSLVPYNAYLAIKNVNETVSTWVPSINDVLAQDWEILT